MFSILKFWLTTYRKLIQLYFAKIESCNFKFYPFLFWERTANISVLVKIEPLKFVKIGFWKGFVYVSATVRESSPTAFITSILLPFSYQIKTFFPEKKSPITRGSIFPSSYLIPTFNVRYHVIYLCMLSKTGHRYRKQMISSICT